MSEEEKINRLLNSIAKGCDGGIADEVKAIIIKQQKEIEELKNIKPKYIVSFKEFKELEEFKKIYISKDKIRNLLKQVNTSLYHFKDSDKNNIVQRLKDRLEELLEE